MYSGLHHIHVRKRITKKELETYPSPRRLVKLLDKVLLVVAIVAPLTTLPQIIQIFQTHDSSNISGITWGLYAFFNLFWLVYGIVHKEKPIIITYILWFLGNITVLSTVFIF